jgi:tRNA-dihydrouridine synthase B
MTMIVLKNPCSGKIITLSSQFFLAPMAGISSIPYRLAAKEHGAGIVCTEMISADGIIRNNPSTAAIMAVSPEEHPVAIQLYGSKSETMARAAQLVENDFDVIDLNSGCPVKKIVKSNSGAALMKQPDVFRNIVSDVVKSVSCPITVKIRSGWDEKNKNAPEIARMAEDSGAAAVIVHPRTRSQGFSGHSDWNMITEVKRAISIPVIGNGDVSTPEDAKALLDITGCDGVMIGRGAMGNPWIFSRSIHYIKTGVLLPEPDIEEKLVHLLKFAKALVNLKGEITACKEIRKFVKCYTKGLYQAKEMRQEAVRVVTLKELEDIVTGYFPEVNL